MVYRTCPYCGANLDPGERCDCKASSAAYAYNITKARIAKATKPAKRA